MFQFILNLILTEIGMLVKLNVSNMVFKYDLQVLLGWSYAL